MASESKKEAFRKYLEASGVLDSLTKVLVALYEEHDKPPIALEFIRKALGGPTLAEYELLLKDKMDLVAKYDALVIEHEECCRKLLEFLPPPPELPKDAPLADDSGGPQVPMLSAKQPSGPTSANSKDPAAHSEKFKASAAKK